MVNGEGAFERDAVYQGDVIRGLYLVTAIVFHDLWLCSLG